MLLTEIACDQATSIALFTPLEPALLCAAHQHGVRILDCEHTTTPMT